VIDRGEQERNIGSVWHCYRWSILSYNAGGIQNYNQKRTESSSTSISQDWSMNSQNM